MLLPKDLVKSHAKILIVDDQASNRAVARHLLANAGFKNFEEAENGIEGLKKVASFRPHLILADVMMPEMDGFEMCRQLKASPKTADIPVLFITGLEDDESRTVGYRLGAVDYVNKPLKTDEVLARTEVHIHNGMLHFELQSYYDRVSADLDKARVMQMGLLPNKQRLKKLNKNNNFSIDGYFQACTELAGDYWQIFDLEDGRVGIILIDFTGHGVAAALNTATIHALLTEMDAFLTNPVNLMHELNNRLIKLLTIDSFATCLYGLYDPKDSSFVYVSCGAEAPALLGENGELKILENRGLPLGLINGAEFDPKLHKTKLKKGTTLLLYSDALGEALHKNGERWLENGVKNAIKHCRNDCGHSTIECLMEQFNKTAVQPLHDDLTLVTLNTTL